MHPENDEINTLKWFFAPSEGSLEKGPNDVHMEAIPGDPWKGLVRESVQNSMDARRDETIPVLVKFKIGFFELAQLGEFNKLQEHIDACGEYFQKNDNARKKFSEMADIFKKYEPYLPYLEISDFNTTGMAYKSGDTNCPFYGFVRSAGVSVKDDGKTGGSFGFGKSAYFKISPLRTVLISTLTKTDTPVFEGVTWLCTHMYDGKKVSHAGFFDNNNGQPAIGESRIPQHLRRTETGTSFYITGFKPQDREKMKRDMIREALQNFWLALYEGKLEVEIEGTRLNKDNLEQMLKEYFPKEEDSGSGRTSSNPRPYFNLIKNYGLDEKIIKIEKEVAPLGKVSLYLARMNAPKDKLLFMRRPRMLVYAKSPGTSYGLYGLFLCDDGRGDYILRDMENPAHNEWKASNHSTVNNNHARIYMEAERVLKEFIQESISAEFDIKDSDNLEITGLNDILYNYVPEDLLGEEQKKAATDILEQSSNISPNSVKDNKNSTNRGSVLVKQTGSHDHTQPASGETKPMGTNSEKSKSTAKGGRPGAGNRFQESYQNDENGSHMTFVPVSFRAFAQEIGGTIWHKIIIYSPGDISEGEIELLIAGDDGDDALAIVSTSSGKISGNQITNLCLKTGKNEIKVLFQDKQKYSIRLKAYEVK